MSKLELNLSLKYINLDISNGSDVSIEATSVITLRLWRENLCFRLSRTKANHYHHLYLYIYILGMLSNKAHGSLIRIRCKHYSFKLFTFVSFHKWCRVQQDKQTDQQAIQTVLLQSQQPRLFDPPIISMCTERPQIRNQWFSG